MWIGLQYENSSWKWTNDDPAKYLNWQNNEPNNYNGVQEDCTAIWTENKWYDFPCNQKQGYICKRDLSDISNRDVDDWECDTKVDHKEYILGLEPETWDVAQAMC